MSEPTEPIIDPATGDDGGTTALEDLAAVLADIGLKPEQIRGRLEASRKWEDRAKEKEPFIEELKAKAKRLDEIEQANKTELERVQAALEAAQSQLSQSETSALRSQVALAKGLTPTQAKRLVGSTLEELEADADELLADLKATAPKSAPSSDGQGKQGEPVGQAKQITSRDQLKSMTPEQIVTARKEGRLDGLLTGKS